MRRWGPLRRRGVDTRPRTVPPVGAMDQERPAVGVQRMRRGRSSPDKDSDVLQPSAVGERV